MKKRPATETSPYQSVSLLSVSPISNDHSDLERIVAQPEWTKYSASKWRLHRSVTLGSALNALRQSPIPIVICERDLPGGTWIDLLQQTAVLPQPPYVIVTSRLADHQLWAEALNLGAYDVLAKPFDTQEVIRIVSLAWMHWRERRVAASGHAVACVA